MYKSHPDTWELLHGTAISQYGKLITAEKRSRLGLTEARVQLPEDRPVQELEIEEEGVQTGSRRRPAWNRQLQLDILLNLFTKKFIALYETMHSCYANSQFCICKKRIECYRIPHRAMRDIRYNKVLLALRRKNGLNWTCLAFC